MGHIMRVDLCVSFIAGLLQAGRAHYAIFNVFIVLRTILHNKNTAKKISASKRFGEMECGNRGQTQQGNKLKTYELQNSAVFSVYNLQGLTTAPPAYCFCILPQLSVSLHARAASTLWLPSLWTALMHTVRQQISKTLLGQIGP
jgi:hypothetical protein